jgi:dynein heavy chain, axonemal
MDHSAFMYPVEPNSASFDKLVIMGGRDLQQYFETACTLELGDDLSALKWADKPAPALEYLLCNNACNAIEAVPHHKVFSFGGKKGAMDYLNRVDVLDAGNEAWSQPAVVPHPRPELAVDAPQARHDATCI